MTQATSKLALPVDQRIDVYPTHEIAGFSLRVGRPLPFGATLVPGGGNFSVFSSAATSCTLVLFKKGEPQPMGEIPFPPEFRIGSVWCMTVFEFDEWENSRKHAGTWETLVNYWGYSTLGFFAPKAGYAATGKLGMQADELKHLVKELHKAGLEVMLDVVFNHTAEGDHRGPTISFRGVDDRTYYILTPEGWYFNFSGCGNTLNCNHPVVRNMVLDCLRYWASEYHIDGFRFDLAAILGRDQNGAPLANPPLLETLAHDPILAKCKLVAEAWDAGGLYQVGSFPAYGRWAEWNGKYRDGLRRFLKGDEGVAREMMTRVIGSPDLYPHRGPTASIKFITCHDNDLNWIDWSLAKKNADLLRFARLVIGFRRAHRVLRRRHHFTRADSAGTGYPDVSFHGTTAWHPDGGAGGRTFAWMVTGRTREVERPDFIWVAMNSHWDALRFEPPALPQGMHWHVAENTGMESPLDAFEAGEEPALDDESHVWIGGRASMILVAR